MVFKRLRSTNGTGYLSFKEIYFESKKCDDYEFFSTMYTLRLTIRMVEDSRYLDTKQNIANACKYIWCGLKVLFYLDPSSESMEFLIDDIRKILAFENREFNEQFKKKRDYELLSYKDPDKDQAKCLSEIKELLSQAN